MRLSQRIDFREMNSRTLTAMHARYRAVNDAGLFLRLDGISFTKDIFYAWRGNNNQFDALNKIHCGRLIKLYAEDSNKPIWRDENGR